MTTASPVVGKAWWTSKTIWFNVLMLVLGLAPVVGVFVKSIQPEMAVLVDAVLLAIDKAGNVILRVEFTDTPIAK